MSSTATDVAYTEGAITNYEPSGPLHVPPAWILPGPSSLWLDCHSGKTVTVSLSPAYSKHSHAGSIAQPGQDYTWFISTRGRIIAKEFALSGQEQENPDLTGPASATCSPVGGPASPQGAGFVDRGVDLVSAKTPLLDLVCQR